MNTWPKKGPDDDDEWCEKQNDEPFSISRESRHCRKVRVQLLYILVQNWDDAQDCFFTWSFGTAEESWVGAELLTEKVPTGFNSICITKICSHDQLEKISKIANIQISSKYQIPNYRAIFHCDWSMTPPRTVQQLNYSNLRSLPEIVCVHHTHTRKNCRENSDSCESYRKLNCGLTEQSDPIKPNWPTFFDRDWLWQVDRNWDSQHRRYTANDPSWRYQKRTDVPLIT